MLITEFPSFLAVMEEKDPDAIPQEYLIDWDTCDFYLTVRILSLIGPCWVRRSSSKTGYHIKTYNKNALIFDDPKRQFRRDTFGSAENVLFKAKSGLIWKESFLRTNRKKFLRKVKRRLRERSCGKWHMVCSLNDFLEVKI